MFCIKCGAVMNDDAEFCAKCGYATGDAEVTRVTRTPGHSNMPQVFASGELEEVHIFSIRPTAIFINIGYILAILGGIVLVILLAMLAKTIGIAVPWWISVLIGLAPLSIPAYHHVMRNMILYTLTDSKIEIDKGFISRSTRNIPLGKIQDVTVTASVIQRLFGFGNLVIENAGEMTGSIVLKNISSPRRYADLLLKELRQFNRGL